MRRRPGQASEVAQADCANKPTIDLFERLHPLLHVHAKGEIQRRPDRVLDAGVDCDATHERLQDRLDLGDRHIPAYLLEDFGSLLALRGESEPGLRGAGPAWRCAPPGRPGGPCRFRTPSGSRWTVGQADPADVTLSIERAA